MNLDLGRIRSELNQGWNELPNTTEIVSSVVVPIFHTQEGEHGFILTQRSQHLKSHPGQISFPGGVKDPEDSDLLSCALREWEEEMGVSRTQIEIIGKHEHLLTRTGFHITPFLGIYSGDFQFSYNRDEVEKVILLPIKSLWNAPFYQIQIPNRGPENTAYYFDLDEGLLWGATCELILRFLRHYASFQREPNLVKPNLNTPPFFRPPRN
ncbi:NUDIX domain protein [Leptospira ryugenii]|uniref:NUDIX domain protein n=1 Tax=Leptospira ryugenii TaxID=1917863 RepID=A0A2P2E2Y2_9LEPT|nr:CoA pyrophosphatase [Leptospira ryugenii]GBF51176.1 NUDIX domain protein [Leptospira ryugenii]